MTVQSSTSVVHTIDIEDITTGSIDGTGIFDQLFKIATLHMDEQYSSSKIRGAEYAKVYLGSITEVLSQSVAFALQKDKLSLELQLLKKDEAKLDAETDLIRAQIQQILNSIEVQNDELELKKAESQAQVALLVRQEEKLTQDIALLLKQSEKLTQDIALSKKQEEKLDSDIQNDKTRLDLDAQRIENEIENLRVQREKLQADILAIQAQRLKIENDIAIDTEALTLKREETEGQLSLLKWKVETEKSQTVGDSTNVYGMVGSQLKVHEAQASGFLRDAEQKIAKIMADAFNVQYATTEAARPENFGLGQDEVRAVMQQAAKGIGLTPEAGSPHLDEFPAPDNPTGTGSES